MYILIGAIVFVGVFIFVRYGTMNYIQKNRNEWGYPNKDIKEAEQKR